MRFRKKRIRLSDERNCLPGVFAFHWQKNKITRMKNFSSGKKILGLLTFFTLVNASVLTAQSSWELLPNSPYTPDRFDDIYFVSDSVGWAVNSIGKIYSTTDAGNSWTLQFDGGYSVYFRSVEFLNADTGFAGTLNGELLKTINGGANWYNISDSLPAAVHGICGMSHFGNIIYAVGVWDSPAYVLKSTDAGATWAITNMSNFADALVDCYFLSADTGFVSGSDNTVSAHGIILKTVDGGASWQVKENTDIGNYVWKLDFVNHQLAYASMENFLFSDTSCILKTTDGGETWTRFTVTDIDIDMEGIGFLNDTLGWCGGWSTGMWETTDGGATWHYLNVGSNFNRYFLVNPNLMYVSGKEIYVYRVEAVPTSYHLPAGNLTLPHTLLPNTPNPFSDFTEIRFELSKATTVRIELFDSRGIRVRDEKPGYLSRGIHRLPLDAANLSSGEYLLVVKTNERTMSSKITCNK